MFWLRAQAARAIWVTLTACLFNWHVKTSKRGITADNDGLLPHSPSRTGEAFDLGLLILRSGGRDEHLMVFEQADHDFLEVGSGFLQHALLLLLGQTVRDKKYLSNNRVF